MSAAGEDIKFAADAIWKILIASVILGAGLPILFATGVRSLAWGTAGAEVGDVAQPRRSNPIGIALAVVLFAVVAYVIYAGLIYVIATGQGSSYDIGFHHLIPVVEKVS